MGRFYDLRYDVESIQEGLTLHQREIGRDVLWFVFNEEESTSHPVFDEGYPGGGRRWNPPIWVPTIDVSLEEGTQRSGEGGHYVLDRITVVIHRRALEGVGGIESIKTDDQHMKDRIAFKKKLFTPREIIGVSRVQEWDSGVRIVADEVPEDKWLHDEDFPFEQWVPAS